MPNAPDLTPELPEGVDVGPGPFPQIGGFVIGEQSRTQIHVARPFVLAPMSGVTDSPFRQTIQAASEQGVGLLVTEFISVEGLTRANLKAAARMSFDPVIERPIEVQIFGADLERMVHAAVLIEESGAQGVDINCGCPAPKVVKRGGGAELMRQCDTLARIVEATATAVRIPVTVKIRAGWSADSINAVAIAKACESAGAQAIAVHGRTRMQLYAGKADWQIVDDVAKAVRVPVIGSGDVCTPQEAVWRLQTTAAKGVMIGRAAIMNPWIFRQIDDLIAGRPVRDPTPADRAQLLHRFADLMGGRMPDHAIPGRLKQLLARMTKGFSHGSLLREKVMRAATAQDMFVWIDGFFDAVAADDLPHWVQMARPEVAQVELDDHAGIIT